MDTISKGYLGQLIVEKAFIKNGYNLYRPILENGKVDLIVEKNNKYWKLQIKTTQSRDGKKNIHVRKVSHNMGQYKIKRYTSDDIDWFIGVDLETEDVYILPVAFSSQYSSYINVSKCNNYKNNFEQLKSKEAN